MRLHLGERPYACDKCSQKFTQAVHLRLHKRLHNNERPYQCEICQKTYISSTGLRTHLKSAKCGAPDPVEDSLGQPSNEEEKKSKTRAQSKKKQSVKKIKKETVSEPSEIVNISSECLAEYYNKAQNVQFIKSELVDDITPSEVNYVDFDINIVQTEPVQWIQTPARRIEELLRLYFVLSELFADKIREKIFQDVQYMDAVQVA